MKGLFLAIQLLTIFPFGINKAEPYEIGKSSLFFPVVGALQGLIIVLSNALLLRIFPYPLVDGLLLVILILTNGGFHLDGFADTIDGIAGGNTKEEKLKIMRDGQIGPMAVIAVILLILIKFISINNLSTESKYAVLFLMPVFGRLAIVPMAYLSDYAREGDGLGKVFAEHTGRKEVSLAVLFTVALAIIFIGSIGLVYIGIILLFTYASVLYFRKIIGGVTGDVFGFHSELTEVFFLLMVL